jgi:queuosine precursor transporter
MKLIYENKANRLFILLAGIFITNALIAEFIGVKIFSLEKTMGLSPVSFSILGVENLSFQLTAGVLLWPIVFVMTDIINEYFGQRGVRILSYLTVGLILYAFGAVWMSMQLTPAEFWPSSHLGAIVDEGEKAKLQVEVANLDTAFRLVFGQGLWIIIASITAFLLAQLIDVLVFHKIKEKTGEKSIWLRATGSTLVSQFIDSFVVLFIAFYLGAGWPIEKIIALGIMSYIYKFLMAFLLTPVLYFVHAGIEAYLGHDLAMELKTTAMSK